VAEHDGRLVRFHPRFLGFAREYNFIPRACNPASGWETGKVEGGAVARADALRPLPVIPYDYCDTVEALVHKDLRLQSDGNRY
jgi:hypothetical protein